MFDHHLVVFDDRFAVVDVHLAVFDDRLVTFDVNLARLCSVNCVNRISGAMSVFTIIFRTASFRYRVFTYNVGHLKFEQK